MQKKILTFFILILFFSSASIFAKCYSFRKTNEVKVCINGDSNADRRKAQNICKQITGMDCGGVGGYTGSCRKGEKLKCYDDEGKEQKNITVD